MECSVPSFVWKYKRNSLDIFACFVPLEVVEFIKESRVKLAVISVNVIFKDS